MINSAFLLFLCGVCISIAKILPNPSASELISSPGGGYISRPASLMFSGNGIVVSEEIEYEYDDDDDTSRYYNDLMDMSNT